MNIKQILAITALCAVPGIALAEGDAEKGEKTFRKCKACHAVGEGAENKVGPVLTGVVGRPVAQVEDFKYSETLTQMGADGVVWSPEELAAFLENPKKHASGTSMNFPGLRKEQDRLDVIAYLATFSE